MNNTSNWKFTPFGTNEIRPRGWLLQQLRIQAAGLCGNLDKVWPDIRDSKWIGGDRDGWERVPYWLDGFIPLAWLLDDADMQVRAKRYIDSILAGQQEDGWICPCTQEERPRYDLWAYFLIAKVLTVYADCSGDERVEPALRRALQCLDKHVESCTLSIWGAARWYEALIPVCWLHERSPEDAGWLLDLVQKLQVEGFDYDAYFADFRDVTPVRRWSLLTHGPNLAMSLRRDALLARLRNRDAAAFPEHALETLTRHHGMANGFFTADECLSGLSPVQGTELCAVVEAMFSYENILAATGEACWADRLEGLAFNALPTTISEDMWTHQYVQQTNQIRCAPLPKDHIVFRTNNHEAHMFGLEPHFGCCTANHGQAWPKLALSAFMHTREGLASTVLVPSLVRTQIDGVDMECILDTDYPFKKTLRYTIRTERPVEFTFSVRIPASASAAWVDGESAVTGGFAEIRRTWEGEQTIDVHLEYVPRLVQRPNDMHCLWNGPLLYALPIEAKWDPREYERDGVERKSPYCDYEVFPQSEWRFAFAAEAFEAYETDVSPIPFSQTHPPAYITGRFAPLPWHEEHGVCLEAPDSLAPTGDIRTLTLIPYGCARLRMTEMPLLKDKS